jgi:hypothetical protein
VIGDTKALIALLKNIACNFFAETLLLLHPMIAIRLTDGRLQVWISAPKKVASHRFWFKKWKSLVSITSAQNKTRHHRIILLEQGVVVLYLSLSSLTIPL